jgi:hypothetical protein
MANHLYRAHLDVAGAIGRGTAAEFHAYTRVYTDVPDLDSILLGNGQDIAFPTEPSLSYAVVTGLAVKARDAQAACHALHWMAESAAPEWVQLFAQDIFRLLRARGQMKDFQALVAQDDVLQTFMANYQALLEA